MFEIGITMLTPIPSRFVKVCSSAFLIANLFLLSACGTSKKTTKEPGKTVKPNTKNSEKPDQPTYTWKEEEEPTENRSENKELNSFVDEWYGTPHVMGGNTKRGVDCSGFVIQCYSDVYSKNFKGRRAEDLFAECNPVKRKDLIEGDLVFFKIHGKRINHVGIYLGDDRFAHTSSSRGVMISNLNEAYFSQRYFMGGRPK